MIEHCDFDKLYKKLCVLSVFIVFLVVLLFDLTNKKHNSPTELLQFDLFLF